MSKGLRITRIAIATIFIVGITMLLLDTTGVLRHWVGWIPKIQLLPAIMSLNAVVIVAVLLATLLIGRLYCSVICPLGIMQDVFIRIRKTLNPKHKYAFKKENRWLRYGVLVLFVVLFVVGLNQIILFIAPYSSYARMVVGLKGTGTVLIISVATLVVIACLSLFYGRWWCNNICPVGTLLGLVSRYSLVKVSIDKEKCVGCHKCEHSCKAMCIDIANKEVDSSRCVDCYDCLSQCRFGAIKPRIKKGKKEKKVVDESRRKFVSTTALVGTTMLLQAQEQKFDGGIAMLEDKKIPQRNTPIKPFGSQSLKNFSSRCTGCQLCVSQCPEHILQPSMALDTFMQPEINYKNGYCRMACTRCSSVCPAGAIQPINKEEKTAISIGFAKTIHENCLSAQGESCSTCERHCPAQAIMMVRKEDTGNMIPIVNTSRCLGCGQCEYYCPARPMSAIYVEGRQTHLEL